MCSIANYLCSNSPLFHDEKPLIVFNILLKRRIAIKKLGSIPLGHLLKFQLSKAMDFIEINDNDHIDLTRAGTECFLSEKR